MSAGRAREIVTSLGGRWRGQRGMAKCPAHKDRSPSLSVTAQNSGFVLVHCFAGCSQAAVLSALRARRLWPDTQVEMHGSTHGPRACSDDEELERSTAAREICA